MALSPQDIAEARKVYETYWESYFAGNIETFAASIDENFSIIGTSEGETAFGKEAVAAMYEAQFDEVVGKAEGRNRQVREIPTGDMLQIIEFSDIYVLIDSEWCFYSKFRLSTLLHQTPDGWKLLQQHGSLPDMRVGQGETVAIDKISKENLELRDAVKRRTAELESKSRELQIEAALEKVRSRSLAMNKSDELTEVVAVLYEKLKDLQIPFTAIGIATRIEGSKDLNAFVCGDNADGLVITNYRLPYFENQIPKDFYNALEKQLDFFVGHYSKEEKDAFYNYVIENTAEFRHLPEDIKKMIFDSTNYTISTVAVKNAVFNVNDFEGKVLTDDEIDIIKRFARVFDQAYTRFLDLQKAEAQAKEAKIEVALEKVRSRTMGMQKSDELADVANVLFAEMNGLVHNLWTCGFVLCEKDRAEDEWWLSLEDGFSRGFFLPNVNDYAHAHLYEGWLKKDDFRTVQLESDKLQEHYDWLMQIPIAKSIFDDMEAAGMQRPEWQKLHAAYFSKGYLVIITREPCAEEEIFKRFATVFDQTYTRFLDLKRAEAQARESQIEAALEKVRSRSLAMQKSDELLAVIIELSAQLQQLNVRFDFVSFGVINPDHEIDFWMAGEGFAQPELFHMPYINSPVTNSLLEAQKKGLRFFESTFNKNDTREWMGVLHENNPRSKILEETKYLTLPGMVRSSVIMKNICVFMGNLRLKPHGEMQNALLMRFANAFEQAYTRFLDLERAEHQAREAQIEAALEKVRSRSLAMQSPDELIEVAQLLREEMGALGVEELETSSIYIHDENSGNTQCWFTIKDADDPGKSFTDRMTIDLKDTRVGQEMLDFYRSDAKQTSILMQGEHRVEWIRYCGVKSNAFTPEGFYGDTIPERTYHLYKFSDGYIGAASPGEISGESWDLLKRATSVFSFAYTRFRDLQKAETRAREARIELALERIRAQVASMQESSDLFDIVVGMRTEFLALGHEADYFWHMRWLPESYEMSMTSEDGSRIGMVISLPKFVHDEIPALAEWEKGNDPIYVLALDPEGAWNYIENMNTHGSYELADPNAPGKEDIAHIGGLTFIMARTTHGEIGYSLPGMVPNPPRDALDTLVRFAGVFDLAYKRFEDLKAAEHQALMIREERDRLEIALHELRATQAQLIQSEKMASLGELTAGIAHEIQNPLNFVNNFSEVSSELIDEALEELAAVQTRHALSPSPDEEDPLSEASSILSDIKQNLEKITHHGKRADAIVKGMLAHSRSGKGEKEPTDLNALTEEYLKLSYHGLRAKDKSFNADFKTDFDPDLPKVNVVPQDIGRVLLNLINNAFQAAAADMGHGHAQTGHALSLAGPLITVSTKMHGGHIEISVKDNGPGIPDAIKDKIFQPFFTTKPTGQGTGLGLSLSYDIVRANNGKIGVEDMNPQGTKITIILPYN